MIVEAQVTIKGSRAAIWAAISNIENAPETIRGIDKIEILERPANGLVGLKWRENPLLFGKAATPDKGSTDAAENEFYKNKKKRNGFVFFFTTRIFRRRRRVTVTWSH